MRYGGQASRLSVFLTDTAAEMAIAGGAPVRLEWRGARRPRFVPAERLKALSNYYSGQDPNRWLTGIPNYAQLKLEGIYPGIDLVYHGLTDSLEFDFVLAPGADASVIEMACEGAAARLSDGDLVLETSAGPIRQLRPRIYQELGEGRVEIAGGYRIVGNVIRFELAAYDRSRPFVIDPVVLFQNYPSATGSATGVNGIGTDGAGNLYAVVQYSAVYYPNVRTSVIKLDPAGTLLYSTALGVNPTFAYGIAVDTAGNAYICGETSDPAFPTTAGALKTVLPTPTGNSAGNGFVTKLSGAGVLSYSTFLGGAGGSGAKAIAVDASGAAYVTGRSDPGFPTTPGAFQATSAASFVSKLNATGNALVYSTYFAADFCDAIAVDSSGAAYLTGVVSSATAFPVTPGSMQQVARASGASFGAKFNPAGSALVYATLLGGSGIDLAEAIAVDTSGNAYIAGSTSSADFPVTPGAYATTASGGYDGFLVKLNANGSAAVYSTYIGGSGADHLTGVAVDGNGIAYLTGDSLSQNFPLTADAYDSQLAAPPGLALRAKNVLVMLNPQGSQLLYSTYFDGAKLIALDNSGNALVGGSQPNGTGFLGKMVFNPAKPLTAFTTAPAPNAIAAAKFTVSGTGCAPGVYQAPAALSWTAGATCTVAVSTAGFQAPTPGQYAFASWGDGNTSNPRIFTAGANTITYTANLSHVQYQVTTRVVPTGGGTVSLSPPSPAGDGFYESATSVTATASAAPGYRFASFGINGSTFVNSPSPASFTVTQGMSVTADFCSFSFNAATQAIPATLYNGSVNLQTSAGCTWSVRSDSSWLTLPQGCCGTGGTSLPYTAAANNGPFRTGQLIVTDTMSNTTVQQFTVAQSGGTPLQVPSLVSLSPFQGSGTNATLTLVYSHPNGWAAIGSAEFILNPRWEPSARGGSCYLKVSPAPGTFTLIADDGSSVAGTSAGGSLTNISNSQCTLNVAQSSVTNAGATVTVVAALTFSSTFTGQKHIWMQAVDTNNVTTNWLVYGVWFPGTTTVLATPWYRIYDPFSKTYLYSSDPNEYSTLRARGFLQQGTSGLVMTAPTTVAGVSNIAWYRVSVNSTSSHFWTSDRNEFLTLINAQQAYVGEGVAAFVMPYINAQGQVSQPVANTIPFYRAAYQGANLHFWTADPNEYIGTNGGHLPPGYLGEGVACYIFPASGAQLTSSAALRAATADAAANDGGPTIVSASHGVVVPGQLLSIYGHRLGGTVRVNGIPAQVVAAKDNEIQVLAPNELPGVSTVNVEVEHRGRRSKPITVDVVSRNPTIFGTNQYGRGNAQAQNEDGAVNSPEHPAARGSVVTLYTTGFRGNDLPVEAHIGGQPAAIGAIHASATRAGVIEVQVRVPDRVEAADFQPVVLRVGNAFSQPGIGLAIR